jgi:YHS domain-containing protein
VTTPAQTVHDPVCHMDIDPGSAAGRSEHEGKTYYFCSMGCKREFDNDPTAALQREAAYDHSQGVDHGMMAGAGSGAAGGKKAWWQFWKK